MPLFSKLYDLSIVWSQKKEAPRYLGLMSFAEAVFFPVPVDVMLAPMVLARPERAWYLAALTTVTSVLGGLVGYFLGLWAYQSVEPVLISLGYDDTLTNIMSLFAYWGFWFVFIAGFTPIPYKIFTISAGAAGIGLIPFVLGSVIGRAGRFFLVSAIVYWGGKKFESQIRRHMEWVGWLMVLALVIVVIIKRH